MKQRSEASSNRIDNFYASGGSARGKFINSRSDEMSWSLLSLFFIFADTSKLNLRRFVLLCFAVGNQNEWVFIGSPSHDRLSLIIYFVFCIDFTCAINIIRQLEIEIIQRFLLSPHLSFSHSFSFIRLLTSMQMLFSFMSSSSDFYGEVFFVFAFYEPDLFIGNFAVLNLYRNVWHLPHKFECSEFFIIPLLNSFSRFCFLCFCTKLSHGQ